MFRWITLFHFLTLPVQAAIELQPHRAYYTVSLEGSPNPQSTVADVQGTMLIEFSKIPEGWVVQERSDIRILHDDGETEHSRWGYATFESADGSVLRFDTYRSVDEEGIEKVVGKAERKGNTIVVTYQKPEKKVVTITDETLFPTQHLRSLLEAAQTGQAIFPRLVFDGSSDVGPSEINTFIGAKKVGKDKPSPALDSQFSGQPFWPVRFAVHSQGKIDYEPLYVTTQNLLPNGIITQYVIDYGSFKLCGVLERVELVQE